MVNEAVNIYDCLEVGDRMDYSLFLSLVNDELNYLEPFSLEGEYELMKAAGALVVLKEYIEAKLTESQIIPLEFPVRK